MLTSRSRSARKAGRSAPIDGPQAVELGRSTGRGGSSVVLVMARSLAPPARLLSCPDRAPGRDPPARRSQRLPARAGGQARGRHRAAAHLVRPARPRPPCAGPPRAPRSPRATGRTASPRSSPGSGGCGPSTARAAAACAVHRSSDPGHWIVTFPWVGAERALTLTEAALALAERDVSPSRTARLTGAQERLAGALDRADRGRPGDAARRGSATPTGAIPIVSISGTNGKSTVTRLITHILLRAGPARRDDDLRRRARRRADGRAGRLDGARRRAPDPRPARPRRRRPRDRPRRDRPARRRLRIERRERPDQRLVRPPRPAGHPHPARAGRGQVDDLPDHEAGRLGRAQRRRPARRRGRPPGQGQRRAVHARGRRLAPSSRRHRERGGRAYLVRDGDDRRGRTARPRRRSSTSPTSRSRSAGWPATTSRTPSRPPAARAGWARRSPQVRDGLRRLRTRRAERSPGRLNLFRVGARVVIVDFAHNEAGVGAVLDVAEGIAAGAAGRAAPITAIIGTAGDRPDDTLARHRPDRRRAGAAGRHQGDAQATCAAGPRESVVGELLVGVVAGGVRRDRRPDLRLRDRGAPGRAQRRGRAGAHGGRADAARVIVLMCHEDRDGVFELLDEPRRAAGRRRLRADRARPTAPGPAAARDDRGRLAASPAIGSRRGHHATDVERVVAKYRHRAAHRPAASIGRGAAAIVSTRDLGLGRLERPRAWRIAVQRQPSGSRSARVQAHRSVRNAASEPGARRARPVRSAGSARRRRPRGPRGSIRSERYSTQPASVSDDIRAWKYGRWNAVRAPSTASRLPRRG